MKKWTRLTKTSILKQDFELVLQTGLEPDFPLLPVLPSVSVPSTFLLIMSNPSAARSSFVLARCQEILNCNIGRAATGTVSSSYSQVYFIQDHRGSNV
jgi:hypothetical protein